ncbi:MAG: hypothetical protein IJW92_02500, partial [Clostridia bacterium]|nr:hypothetical protein [Clostridia bacterium]
MAEQKMLAIDLGASSGRGIVGAFDGEKLSLKENHRFSNDPVIVGGRMYWDILRIFHEIKQSITKTVLEKDDIRSIGIDTWGVDYALLDDKGRMLANPFHYRDTRTDGIVPYIGRFFSQQVLYAVTALIQYICSVGINFSYANILYINLPEEDSTAYISFNTIGCNIFAFLGMITGTYVSSIGGDAPSHFLGM